MKRSLLASTALCALLVQSALAADLLPTKKGPPPAPVAAPFSWTGFYIGANAGGLWSRDGVDESSCTGGVCSLVGTDTLDLSGVVGGVQAGYNYQIQSFVLGVEGDLDWSSAKGSDYPVISGQTHSASLPFFADLRARLGVAIGRVLPYVTGGVVVADVQNKLDPAAFSLDRGGASTGWAIGGGAEYAIDAHWSVKVDCLYMQFPSVTKTQVVGCGYNSAKFEDSAEVARVAVNYRF